MADLPHRPLVQLKDGAVRGTVRSGVSAFLGIPYAAAPFGANRMQPPQPVRPGTVNATPPPTGRRRRRVTTLRSITALFPEVVIPGEDCLNLNVWTPDPGATGLPGAGLDSRRLVHERIRVGGRVRRQRVRARRRRVRDHQLPAGRRRLPVLRRRHRQPRPAGPAGGAAVGAGQHRRVRRRSGPGHRGRRVGRGHERDHAAVDAARRGLVQPGHRAERRRGAHAHSRTRRSRSAATSPTRSACRRTGTRSRRCRSSGSSRPHRTWSSKCRPPPTRPSGASSR